ncbi:hypothetical protein [Saccharopolyspora spinosa]|uniref:hypothetical protein n=1 Tax=Saccharopolyspora spinosa TaxID=60894 RepID=UPI0002379E1E|nr:hypothetical protein [Saccharopolyspora spinosa]
MNFETRLDDVVPPEQHLPLVVARRRSPRDEPFEHGTAIGQPVLQREAVDGEDGPALVENAVAIGRLEQHRVQPPCEARAFGRGEKLDQILLPAKVSAPGAVRTGTWTTAPKAPDKSDGAERRRPPYH